MDFITSSGKRLIKFSEKSSSRQYHEGESLQSHEASSKKRPQIDFATRQYQLHKQQHEAGPSHQGDARPARTEKRKPHQTLSLETSKSQRQKTASSRDSLEDFAASLEAELRKEGQGDIWPADIKERQDTTFSPSLKDISTRLHAEFTKQDLSRGLNRDDQKELVLRKISYSIYNSIISNSLIHRLKKSEQGKGRYTQEELLQSKKKLQALKPEIINGTKKAYDALQEIIKNPSNDAEKSAAQLVVYHMTRKD
jgi:hypothetical protein